MTTNDRRTTSLRLGHLADLRPATARTPEDGSARRCGTRGLPEALARQVADAGFTLEHEALPDGAARGYTSYSDHRVVVAERLGPADAIATLAHEVGHMLMHNVEDFPDTTYGCRGVREVEAESVAYIVLAHHGLDTSRITFPYVATWAATADRGEPEQVVQDTGQRVVSVARAVIQATAHHPDSTGVDVREHAVRRTVPPVIASHEPELSSADLERGEPPCS